MFIQIHEFDMEAITMKIIKHLIHELNQKLNIIAEYEITNRLNDMVLYKTRIYGNNHCGT